MSCPPEGHSAGWSLDYKMVTINIGRCWVLDPENPFKHVTVVTTLLAQESSGINGSGIVEKIV